jgi:cell division inhibitor SulA
MGGDARRGVVLGPRAKASEKWIQAPHVDFEKVLSNHQSLHTATLLELVKERDMI